ncbi:MAG: 50S ribosomal protein L2 [Thermoprotei archaeon]|nr:50S ribosomal protein L2 [TACK group archaeon]
MGKHILVQREGRGNINFRSPHWLRKARVAFPAPGTKGEYVIADFIHEPGRGAPLALLVSKENQANRFYAVAAEGLGVGNTIRIEPEGQYKPGDILPLSKIPDGERVCSVELRPGDGGKLVRASGEYAIVSGHSPTSVNLILPSKKVKVLPSECRAMVGVVAGGGRAMAPMLKAGVAYHLNKRKARKWPQVRGVAMNAVSHPHGGGGHQSVSRPSTVARNTPPGRKVGHIAARRTGIRKR